MSRVFRTDRRLRFSECDPAGIAFYPRLVEGVNNTVEDWFEHGLGFSFRNMHLDNEVRVPTRSLQVEFLQAAKLGEDMSWTLSVLELGRSSFKLEIQALDESGNAYLSAYPVLIWCGVVDGELRSVEIPQNIRSQMSEFLAS